MKRKLIALCLLPLIAFSQTGDWYMDFDEDFAAAVSMRSWFSPLDLSPVAWWNGNGTTNDASGNAMHGTWSGVPGYTNGINGQAFQLRGAQAVVRAFDASLATTNTTICMWARVEGGAGSVRTVASIRQVSPNAGYWMTAFSDNNYGFRPAPTLYPAGTVVAATIGTWFHLASSYDGISWRWYVNGSQSGVAFATTYDPPTTSSFMIGALTDGGPRLYFIGAIDDVMIFNRALTANEIAQIYNWRQ